MLINYIILFKIINSFQLVIILYDLDKPSDNNPVRVLNFLNPCNADRWDNDNINLISSSVLFSFSKF